MKKILLRLPDNLFLAVKTLAENEHRSVNSQIIAILDNKLNTFKKDAKTNKKSEK